MSVIHVLPEQVINQIAAGEVVERPASIVKELVENSIDAGATHIRIELRSGGKSLIEIRDNGSGIEQDDLKPAFLRHATSKITALDDLDQLISLGFRGEALASIASVSMTTVETSTVQSSPVAYTLTLNHGEISSEGQASRQHGTTISIEHLFAKVPARRKFLKSDRQELAAISRLLQEMALTFPHIHFELIHENKSLINTQAQTSLLERFYQVTSKELQGKMYELKAASDDMSFEAIISSPVIKRTNRTQQMVSINGRVIKDFRLSKIIADAYHGFLLSNEHPIFFVHLHVDPASIDVNVHPRKSEIRFSNPDQIYSFIYREIRQFLSSQQFSVQPTLHFPSTTPVREPSSHYQLAVPFQHHPSASSIGMAAREQTLPSIAHAQLPSEAATTLFTQTNKPIRVLSQIKNSYILCEDHDTLILFDQHAAHERLLYEQFKQATGQQLRQPLLIPTPLHLANQQALLLEEQLELLNKLGFELEQSSPTTWLITTVPVIALLPAQHHFDWATIILSILELESGAEVHRTIDDQQDDILHTMACKAAVKFNDHLSIGELQRLIDDVAYLPGVYTCPHGRPFRLVMKFNELNHYFKRH
ncbi:DNA mismatch repair endonuclease MutL [Candidatus Gracilibacteria bacterium]|nr:DNA mismatch repair endonuclease MutL [Candidatus Gracilibacteria bacterium]